MKNPANFLKSIYLGDRVCKAISLDTWNAVVRIRIDVISRIRSDSGNWEFHKDEDVENGSLVFGDVKAFSMSPDGLLPNDLVNSVSIAPAEGNGLWNFRMGVDSVDENGCAQEVQIAIVARTLWIERQDGVPIDD
ncbi:DUF6258 family protein [Burkholderia cepacia]|uniref:DUF6258 family protein n=1 Tax=Burkholderia cepacia TaxID=292 RepID=UPI00398E9D52